MDRDVAYQVYTGQIPIPEEATMDEIIQLSMGACLEDNGDLWCLVCNRPNECCTCGESIEELIREEDQYYWADFDLDYTRDEDRDEYEELDPSEQYCESCGRSHELCDCDNKEIEQ